MRRLHCRGSDCRGVHGAMLGPDRALVRRTAVAIACLSPGGASRCARGGPSSNWLLHQSRRIADALAKGEIALAGQQKSARESTVGYYNAILMKLKDELEG
jgi:hypothetical protein